MSRIAGQAKKIENSELNFVLVYILARYRAYQGEFFASEVVHFSVAHFKKCL